MYFLAKGAISWTSKKQDTVALSSTEAEYMAISDAAKQALWIRNFHKEIGLQLKKPTEIVGDNKGSIFHASENVTSKNMKHIRIKVHHIRQEVKRKEIFCRWTKSQQNIADALTKIITKDAQQRYTQEFGLTKV